MHFVDKENKSIKKVTMEELHLFFLDVNQSKQFKKEKLFNSEGGKMESSSIPTQVQISDRFGNNGAKKKVPVSTKKGEQLNRRKPRARRII